MLPTSGQEEVKVRDLTPEDRQALIAQLETAAKQIRGLVSARIVLDETGSISEIHAVGSSTRRPKAIVRDIESLLLARYGIHVDYRRISLVQLEHEETTSNEVRLRFVVARADPADAANVEVILKTSSDYYDGISSIEGPSADNVARATAYATISAVRNAIPMNIPLSVDGVEIVRTDGNEVCLTLVSALTASGTERLTGTCIVAGSVHEAACKATLDAINRRIPVWVTRANERSTTQRHQPDLASLAN